MPHIKFNFLGQLAERIEKQKKRVIFCSCCVLEKARKVGVKKILLSQQKHFGYFETIAAISKQFYNTFSAKLVVLNHITF